MLSAGKTIGSGVTTVAYQRLKNGAKAEADVQRALLEDGTAAEQAAAVRWLGKRNLISKAMYLQLLISSPHLQVRLAAAEILLEKARIKVGDKATKATPKAPLKATPKKLIPKAPKLRRSVLLRKLPRQTTPKTVKLTRVFGNRAAE